MRILINASNLKKGGGLQVADSFCCLLNQYERHRFVVVLSHYLATTAKQIEKYSNVKVIMYDMPKNIRTFFTGRDMQMDSIVEKEGVDAVLTIFGPSLWIPKVLHISGFARAHCVLKDSPYFTRMRWNERLMSGFNRELLLWAFKRCANVYFTENEYISTTLRSILNGKTVYTVTNYYNQVFDDYARWTDGINLPQFNGITLLTISANYPHKNLSIIIPTVHYLKEKYPDFSFRFVLTIDKENLVSGDDSALSNIVFLGTVPLTECPHLYEQSDIVFSSSLLECFTAVYPEAMRMGKPIITTDLNFSRSLCGDAALYYDALSSAAFGEAIYKLANDDLLRNELVEKGKKQLTNYDTYEARADKLISIVEKEYMQRNNNLNSRQK